MFLHTVGKAFIHGHHKWSKTLWKISGSQHWEGAKLNGWCSIMSNDVTSIKYSSSTVSEGDWFQEPLCLLNPEDAQVPSIKGDSKMNSQCSISTDMKLLNTEDQMHIYWEKKLHVSESAQFKPVLLKGQLQLVCGNCKDKEVHNVSIIQSKVPL